MLFVLLDRVSWGGAQSQEKEVRWPRPLPRRRRRQQRRQHEHARGLAPRDGRRPRLRHCHHLRPHHVAGIGLLSIENIPFMFEYLFSELYFHL